MRSSTRACPLSLVSVLVLFAVMDVNCCAAQEAPISDRVPRAQGWKLTFVIDDLEHPWGMVFLPSGDMLITERPGRLRLVRDGKLVETPVAGLPQVLAHGQGGLLDIALHPQFPQNQWVYLTYAAGTPQQNRTTLARARFDGQRLHDLQVLFAASPEKGGGAHFGSRLLFLPDGTLLMSVGDGGHSTARAQDLARHPAQRLDSHLGKVIRLNDDGSVPKDNPFVGRTEARPEIYSYGHRNIQGLALDPRTQQVWATEHGPRGGDELNLIRPGANYGWPIATFGRDYRTNQPVSPHTSLPDMIDPRLVWIPSIATSGLTFYAGQRFPHWNGHLLAGGLIAQEIRLVEPRDQAIVSERSLPIRQRVRDIVLGPDELVYVLTDEPNGQLLRIEPQ